MENGNQTSGRKKLHERLQKLEDEINFLIELQASAKRTQEVVAAVSEPHPDTTQPVVIAKERQVNTFHRECATATKCPCCKNHCQAGPPVKPTKDPKPFRYDRLGCFLQNINYNLARGTEAISKIAGFAELTHVGFKPSADALNDQTHLLYNQIDDHQPGFTKCNFLLNERISHNNFRKFWNKNDEINSLYKELRDEKDKRQRAENQIKTLKEEMKKVRTDLQQEYETKSKQLSQQFKEEQTKLLENINLIERIKEENATNDFKWRDKYDIILKDLSCKKERCSELERHVEELKAALANKNFNNSQETQRRLHAMKDTHLKLQDELTCLSLAKHKVSIKNEELKAQLQSKENDLFFCKQKLEQLTSVCEKLRDKVLSLKEKADQAEHRLECKEKILATLSNRYLLNETQMKEEIVSKEARYNKVCSEWADREKVLQEELDRLSEKHKALEREYGNRDEKYQFEITRLKEHIDLLTASSKAESDKNKELVEELSTAVDNYRTQIDVLTQSSKKQENEIASQKEALKSKDEQVRLSFNELIACRQQLEEARQTKSNWQQEWTGGEKEQDIQRLKQRLQEEKDKVLIKEKIIEDHLKTIQNMKVSSNERHEEIVKMERERFKLERMLNDQERMNEQLSERVHYLRLRKEEQKEHIFELENELQQLRLQPDLANKQMEVLRNLEKEVESKHKEWTEQVEAITKEKEGAIEAAKHSAQKLSQIMRELDEVSRRCRQLEEIVSKLDDILKNKEKLLNEERNKVSILEDELQKKKECFEMKIKCLETKLRKACEVCSEAISDVQLQVAGKD